MVWFTFIFRPYTEASTCNILLLRTQEHTVGQTDGPQQQQQETMGTPAWPLCSSPPSHHVPPAPTATGLLLLKGATCWVPQWEHAEAATLLASSCNWLPQMERPQLHEVFQRFYTQDLVTPSPSAPFSTPFLTLCVWQLWQVPSGYQANAARAASKEPGSLPSCKCQFWAQPMEMKMPTFQHVLFPIKHKLKILFGG